MAFAPSAATTSSSASPVSHGIALSPGLPSQSSSPQVGAPPSALVCRTSMAPGFTLGSQSLQSPPLGVQPSLSMSPFGSVTWQFVGLPPLLPPSPKEPGVPPELEPPEPEPLPELDAVPEL